MKKKHYIINLMLFIFSFFLIESVNASSTCTYDNGRMGIKFTINNTMVTATGIYSNSKIVRATKNYEDFVDNNGKIRCPSKSNVQISEQDPDGTIGYSFTFENNALYPISIGIKGSQIGNNQNPGSNNNNNSANNNNKPDVNSESKPDKGTTSISTGTNCNALFGDKNDNRSIAYWLQWGLDLMKYIAIIALLALSTIDFIKALVADDKDAIKKASMTTAKRFVFAVLIFFLPIVVEMLMNLFGAYGTCDIG